MCGVVPFINFPTLEKHFRSLSRSLASTIPFHGPSPTFYTHISRFSSNQKIIIIARHGSHSVVAVSAGLGNKLNWNWINSKSERERESDKFLVLRMKAWVMGLEQPIPIACKKIYVRRSDVDGEQPKQHILSFFFFFCPSKLAAKRACESSKSHAKKNLRSTLDSIFRFVFVFFPLLILLVVRRFSSSQCCSLLSFSLGSRRRRRVSI